MSEAHTQDTEFNPLEFPLWANCRAAPVGISRIWFEVVEYFTFVVKLLCKWGPPWHNFKELVLYVQLPSGPSFWTFIVLYAYAHGAALSSHGRLHKHAKQGWRWKAACLRLVSLSVCCFCVPQLDWHGLSNNMAGRQYESLVGFYPLKWYSIIFWWAFFARNHAS